MKKEFEIKINCDGTIQIDRNDTELLELFENIVKEKEREYLRRFFVEGKKIKEEKKKLKSLLGKAENKEVEELWNKFWCG